VSENTASAPAAIIIEGARKDYGAQAGGRREAVADVSLSVSQGAIHGLLGPNGAGKTTTLKMLLGLVRPSGGTFQVLGVDAHKPGARAQLGFLPEQPYFPIQLTVIEALTLYGRLAGLTKAQVVAEAPALLERVGLGGQGGTRLSRFSRGMLQRLGLAQAMLGSPKVVVLDEPASALDVSHQLRLFDLLKELNADGLTVLVDCGRGVLMRLVAAGVVPPMLDALLITHLHSDHITDLGDVITTRWVMSPGPRPLRGSILIGHTHWDHIQGLPFFAPLFVRGNEWDIYAPRGFEQSLHETLAGQMQYTYFPITLEQLSASIRYHEIVEGVFAIGDLRVTAQYLNHPALTLGYRLEADGVADYTI